MEQMTYQKIFKLESGKDVVKTDKTDETSHYSIIRSLNIFQISLI